MNFIETINVILTKLVKPYLYVRKYVVLGCLLFILIDILKLKYLLVLIEVLSGFNSHNLLFIFGVPFVSHPYTMESIKALIQLLHCEVRSKTVRRGVVKRIPDLHAPH